MRWMLDLAMAFSMPGMVAGPDQLEYRPPRSYLGDRSP
jgi:hypothetical protein